MNRPSQSLSLEQLSTARTEQEYLRMREFMPANLDTPLFWVREGSDGAFYAVFENSDSLMEFDLLHPEVFEGCEIDNFGWHDNAFYLGRLQ